MNKIKYEKRMKELDQIAEEQQLRQQVRDRERELGLRRTRKKPAWGKAMMAVIYGLCARAERGNANQYTVQVIIIISGLIAWDGSGN